MTQSNEDAVKEIYADIEGRLSVDYYTEDGAWAISYTMPNKSRIRFNRATRPELVLAQVRGMIADYVVEKLGLVSRGLGK